MVFDELADIHRHCLRRRVRHDFEGLSPRESAEIPKDQGLTTFPNSPWVAPYEVCIQ